MNAQDRRKKEWVKNASTEVLERIMGSLAGNEVKERSPEFPLGGLVHIEGLGQVRVAAIRGELARRTMSDLDKAVVAYRENPTEENRAHLMREQEKHMHEFFQREQKELA